MKSRFIYIVLLLCLHARGQTYKMVNEVKGLPAGALAYLFADTDQALWSCRMPAIAVLRILSRPAKPPLPSSLLFNDTLTTILTI